MTDREFTDYLLNKYSNAFEGWATYVISTIKQYSLSSLIISFDTAHKPTKEIVARELISRISANPEDKLRILLEFPELFTPSA